MPNAILIGEKVHAQKGNGPITSFKIALTILALTAFPVFGQDQAPSKRIILPFETQEGKKELIAPFPNLEMPRKELFPTKVEKNSKYLLWHAFKKGDVFSQHVEVRQTPSFQFQNVRINALLHYEIVSKLTIKKQGDSGQLFVEQEIQHARLRNADATSKEIIATMLAKLPGTKFNMVIAADGTVASFEGMVAQPIGLPIQLMGGQGFQFASLLDADGWKEMAGATFFVKPRLEKSKSSWRKPMTHSWGPLGRWQGVVGYEITGRKESIERVSYEMFLKHTAEKGVQRTPLPLNIEKTAFRTNQARGNLFLNTDTGRVISAEERFQVEGQLTVLLLGQRTTVAVSEDQHFRLQIFPVIPK